MSIYIPGFSELAKPLREVATDAQGGHFVMTEAAEAAFNALRLAARENSMLKRFDPKKELHLMTDWSKHGLGAALFQPDDEGNLKALLFLSRSMAPAERNYDATEEKKIRDATNASLDSSEQFLRVAVAATFLTKETEEARSAATCSSSREFGVDEGIVRHRLRTPERETGRCEIVTARTSTISARKLESIHRVMEDADDTLNTIRRWKRAEPLGPAQLIASANAVAATRASERNTK